jgi:hypothetical protein
MPNYDVVTLVTVTKTSMINKIPCVFGTIRSTGVRIWHKVSAGLDVSHRPA